MSQESETPQTFPYDQTLRPVLCCSRALIFLRITTTPETAYRRARTRAQISGCARGILFWLFVGVISPAALSAQTHAEQGAQRFMEYCAGCHGTDGKGGDKAASLAMTLSVMTRSDSELEQIVREGTMEGMPPFSQIGDANIHAIVGYLHAMEGSSASASAGAVVVTGDVHAGRSLYFGKARCAACHRINGDGGFIASDLTAFSQTHTADGILQAITKPDNPVAGTSRVATLTTIHGTRLTGVLRYEDDFSLALQTEDGRYHLLSKNELTAVAYSGHSLIPRDYADQLSSRELNDLVSFLIVAGRSSGIDSTPPH